MAVSLHKRATFAAKVILGDAIEGEWMTGLKDRDVFRLRGTLAETTGNPVFTYGFLNAWQSAPNAKGGRYYGPRVFKFFSTMDNGCTLTIWVQKEN